MIFNLIQSDLDKGYRMNCRWCPVARAIERITGKTAYVGYEKIAFDGKEYETPKNVKKFIDLFDKSGARNLPLIEFELKV